MTLTLRELDDTLEPAWEDFVAQCPEATFFHRAGWRDVIGRSFGHRSYYLMALSGREVEGILPLTHVKSRLFGNALISNAFCVGGGPAARSDEARDALLGAAEDLLKTTGADVIELRDVTFTRQGWTEKSGLYATFDRPIAAAEDDCLKQIPRKQRAVVRKALKAEDLHVAIEDTLDPFYPLYALSVRNLGTPVYGRKYFAALKEVFGDACEILTVRGAGQPLCSVLSFYFRDTVLPYYTGGTLEARRRGANDLMYWSVMRRAVERGYTRFDFGRSKVGTGPFSFKKNWGFEPRPIRHVFYLKPGAEVPDVNPLNPKYRLFISLWQRLPLPVANALGPHIVRNIG